MRNRAAVCLALVLATAACSDDGVSIEIHRGTTTATKVELYLVDGHCTTDETGETPCPQLKTPSSTRYLDGDVYTRQDAQTLSATMSGDVAYFTIKADGDQTEIPLGAAVGFDAQGVRVGAVMLPEIAFHTTDNNRRIYELEAIKEDTVTGLATSDGLRAETWYQEMQSGGCLAIEKRHDGQLVERRFIVPHDDLDCDDWIEPQECDAIWPDRTANDRDNSLPFTCVVEESRASGGGKRCLLGDAPCIDGEGPADCRSVAMGNKWCVPSALCDTICKDSPNPLCIYGALKNPTMPANKHPAYVHCKVPVEDMGGKLAVCRSALDVEVDATIAVPAPATCSTLTIGQVQATDVGPFGSTATPMNAPASSIQTSINAPCGLSLTFSGQYPPTPMVDVVPDHALKLDLMNGFSLVVPILVDLIPVAKALECQSAMATCSLVVTDPNGTIPDDSLASCAAGD